MIDSPLIWEIWLLRFQSPQKLVKWKFVPWTIGGRPSLVASLVTRLNKSRLGNCPFNPSTLTFKWVNFSWDISKLIAAWIEPARASRSPCSSTCCWRIYFINFFQILPKHFFKRIKIMWRNVTNSNGFCSPAFKKANLKWHQISKPYEIVWWR